MSRETSFSLSLYVITISRPWTENKIIINVSRVLLEATTDVEAEELMDMTTIPYKEVEFMEDIEDVGLDNTEVNCHKCLKGSFKFRKVFSLMVGHWYVY